jgi:hypothetical protein
MPNWVYNTITISGESKSDIDELASQLSRPVPRHDEVEKPHVYEDTEFSFWNIKAPEPAIWDEYFSIADGSAPENNWYSWNNANWGTKWDASNTETYREDKVLVLNFDTAWSPVDGLVRLLSLQFRHLSFEYRYEEEQGWGGEMEIEAGEVGEREEWDIPDSHADYEKRDRLESCNCQWSEDEDDWYEDCPREKTVTDPDAKDEE